MKLDLTRDNFNNKCQLFEYYPYLAKSVCKDPCVKQIYVRGRPGGGGQEYCDNSAKASVIKSVTMFKISFKFTII